MYSFKLFFGISLLYYNSILKFIQIICVFEVRTEFEAIYHERIDWSWRRGTQFTNREQHTIFALVRQNLNDYWNFFAID